MKRTFSILAILLAATLVLSACGAPAATQAPAPVTQAPAAPHNRSSDRSSGRHARRGPRCHNWHSAASRLHADGRHAR